MVWIFIDLSSFLLSFFVAESVIKLADASAFTLTSELLCETKPDIYHLFIIDLIITIRLCISSITTIWPLGIGHWATVAYGQFTPKSDLLCEMRTKPDAPLFCNPRLRRRGGGSSLLLWIAFSCVDS